MTHSVLQIDKVEEDYRRIQKELPALTPVNAAVAEPVAAFYDRFPYPFYTNVGYPYPIARNATVHDLFPKRKSLSPLLSSLSALLLLSLLSLLSSCLSYSSLSSLFVALLSSSSLYSLYS